MRIHKTAEVSKKAKIGNNTNIWNHAQIREHVICGSNCIIGKGAYLDSGVVVGNNVKVENYASIFHGTTIEDNVFIGPYVCITNDKFPRATTPNGKLKTDADWKVGSVVVKKGASLGAGTIVLPNVTIGRYALTAAGSVVTKDVQPFTLVAGVPSKFMAFICGCGKVISKSKPKILLCSECKKLKRKYES